MFKQFLFDDLLGKFSHGQNVWVLVLVVSSVSRRVKIPAAGDVRKRILKV
jgi:hypothetical protein